MNDCFCLTQTDPVLEDRFTLGSHALPVTASYGSVQSGKTSENPFKVFVCRTLEK